MTYKPPSQREMENPGTNQRGEPNYIDPTAANPQNARAPNKGSMDVPAYYACDPRYWEYR